MAIFVPAILEDSIPAFNERLSWLSQKVDRIHIDVADNSFVPTMTVQTKEMELPRIYPSFDLHMMVSDPLQYLPDYLRLEPDNVIVHAEIEHLAKVVETLYANNLSVGIAVKPETSLLDLEKFVADLDAVLIMGHRPGSGDLPILPETFDRVAEARELFPGLSLMVDGGVRLANVHDLIEAQASVLVVGQAGYDKEGNQSIENWKDQSFCNCYK